MLKLNQEVRICSHRTGRQRYNGQVGIIIGTESTCLECNDNAFWVVRIGTECLPYLEDELYSLDDERRDMRIVAEGFKQVQKRLLDRYSDYYDCVPVEKGHKDQVVTWEECAWRPK